MLRKTLVCFTTVVLVGASLVPEDALAYRRGGAASVGGGRYATAGRGYGYHGGAYRGAAWRGAAYGAAALGTAAAIGSAYGYAGASYSGYAGAPYGGYGYYDASNCAPGPRVGAYATAPWSDPSMCY